MCKGVKNLVKDTSYSPNSQEYRNRYKNINELIELIKKHNIKSVESAYDEFKKLYNRLKELSGTEAMNYQRLSASAPPFKPFKPFKIQEPSPSAPPFNNQGFSANAPPPKNQGLSASERPFNNQGFSASARPFNNKKNKKDIRIGFITTGSDLNKRIHKQIKEILDLIFHKYDTKEISRDGFYSILFRGFTNLKKNEIEKYIKEISKQLNPIRNEIKNYNNNNFQKFSLVFSGILQPQVTEFWKNESGNEERSDLRNNDE